jgi:hypothetical protein
MQPYIYNRDRLLYALEDIERGCDDVLNDYNGHVDMLPPTHIMASSVSWSVTDYVENADLIIKSMHRIHSDYQRIVDTLLTAVTNNNNNDTSQPPAPTPTPSSSDSKKHATNDDTKSLLNFDTSSITTQLAQIDSLCQCAHGKLPSFPSLPTSTST